MTFSHYQARILDRGKHRTRSGPINYSELMLVWNLDPRSRLSKFAGRPDCAQVWKRWAQALAVGLDVLIFNALGEEIGRVEPLTAEAFAQIPPAKPKKNAPARPQEQPR